MANENELLLKQLLTIRRRNMGKANRNRSRKTTEKINWLYPHSIEKRYAKGITTLMRSITLPATEEIFDQLDSWIDDYELLQGRIDSISKEFKLPKKIIQDSIFNNKPITTFQYIKSGNLSKLKRDSIRLEINKFRYDSYPDDFNVFMKELQEEFNKKILENPSTRAFITTIGLQVSDQNKKQWHKFSKKLLGIEFVTDEPWETETIKSWGDTNLGLIKGLGDDYVKRINTIVSEGVQFGRTSQSIRKEIRKVNKDINKTRANLIARDQVGKLNGQLTKRRQQDAGLDWYIWSTAQDERVRGNPTGKYPKAVPSHFIMNGKVCKWNDNTVYSDDGGKTWKKRTGKMPIAIPGEEIQCRCTALAFFADILAEVDAGIKKEEERRAA
jgi:SPP1 gp7 family putative phage head morphogenesis protein